MKKKLLIIGGGIAGLSAGIYGQKAGFITTIVEKHSIVGGQLTGWYRNGNYIDGCIHFLMGTKKGTEMHKVWQEIAAFDDNDVIKMPNFTTYKSSLGEIVIWRDLQKFKQELLTVSLEDKKYINKFIHYIKQAKTLKMPAKKRLSSRSFFELLIFGAPMIPAAIAHQKAGRYSLFDFSQKFKNPLLKEFFTAIFSSNHNLYSFCVALGSFMDGNADIPGGGSLNMAQNIAKRYRDLGGIIKLNTTIKKANISNQKIVSFTGINTKTNDHLIIDDFDYVIFTGDIDNVYHHILENNYNDSIFEERFINHEKYPIPTCCLVAFSADADMSEYPHSIMIKTNPFTVALSNLSKLSFRNYFYFQNNTGKTTVISMITQTSDDYDYWHNLYENDNVLYHAEKKKIADFVLLEYQKLFPKLTGKLTYLDMTTPVTYHNYLNAFKGGYMSFKKTKKTPWKSHHGAINGIDNALISGQWTQIPGGAPVAAVAGKFTIMDLEKITKKQNKTT